MKAWPWICVLIAIAGCVPAPTAERAEATPAKAEEISKEPVKPKVEKATTPKRAAPKTETKVLRSGEPYVPLALSKEAFEELNRAAGRRDVAAFANVFYRGQALEIPDGTRVEVIEGWLASRKVRVLEGRHAGRSGWVSYEFVK